MLFSSDTRKSHVATDERIVPSFSFMKKKIERQDVAAHIYLKLCSFFNYENNLIQIKFYKKTKQKQTLKLFMKLKTALTSSLHGY